MLSLHTKRKRILTAVLTMAVVLSTSIFALQRILVVNGVFAVDYPMPAGFNDQVFYNCIVGQFKSQFPDQPIPESGLTDEQLAMMTSLNCNGESYATKITDTSGLEKMTGLTYLNVSNNEIPSVNVSSIPNLRNLQVGNNMISALDISNNTELVSLAADYNSLTEINVANRAKLRELDIKHNQLSVLDVSNDTNLTSLVADYNIISSLNTTNATALTTLKAYGDNLSSLDLSTNTNLTHLQVDYNQFTELDLTGSTKLVELRAESNPMTSLNVSGLTDLENLYVAYNYLSSIDLSSNTGLVNVEVYSNGLSELNLANSSELATVKAQTNMLNSLVLPETETLTLIDVSSNQLSAIDVSNNPNLTSLAVQNNHLSSLDVSNNPSLKTLTLQDNPSITNMDISGNTALTTFRADDIPVKTNLSLSSAGETTSFSLNDLKFLKVTQSIPDTENYTYSSVTKTLTMKNGYANYAQVEASFPGMSYKFILPMYLSYDANGGAGVPDAEVCYPESGSSECSYTVSTTEPTKDDGHFVGWSTDPSATSPSYVAGNTFTANDYATLYAVWSPIYTLSYNLNGGEGSFPDQTCYSEGGSTTACVLPINENEPAYGDHVFLGWSTNPSATVGEYHPGDSITLNSDTELTAIWGNRYTLDYDLNGGEGVFEQQSCQTSAEATASCSVLIYNTEPTKTGVNFYGWADSADAKVVAYRPNTEIVLNSDKIIYAVWGESDIDWDGQDYKKGEGDGIVLRPVYPLNTLDSVFINGSLITDNYYEIDLENNTLKLKPTYLDLLPTGEYTVRLVFADGSSAEVTINIVIDESDDPSGGETDPSAEPSIDESGNVVLDLNTPKIAITTVIINIYDEGGNLVKTIEVSDPGDNVRIDVSDLPNGNYTAELIHKDKDGNVILVTTEDFVKDDNTSVINLSVHNEVDLTKQIVIEVFDENGELARTIRIDTETGTVYVYDKDGNLINTIENGYVNGKLVLPLDGLAAGTYKLKVSYLDKDGRVISTLDVDGIEYEDVLPVPNTGSIFHHAANGLVCNMIAVGLFMVIAFTGAIIIKKIN